MYQTHFHLIPLPCRLWARASAGTLIVLCCLLEPLLGAQRQVPVQLIAWVLAVDEIAEPAPHTALTTVKTTTGFPEVRHGTQLAVDGARSVPAAIEVVAGLLRRLLVLEARVDVANQVVIVVVAHDELFELAVLAALAPNVFVKGVKVILQLAGVHTVLGVEGWVLVQVGHEDRLRVGGLDVFA